MTYDAHKHHKKMNDLDERMTTIESLIFVVAKLGGICMIVIGIAGFFVTLYADKLRGRLIEWDWFQVTGIVTFLVIGMAGIYMLWLIRNKKGQ